MAGWRKFIHAGAPRHRRVLYFIGNFTTRPASAYADETFATATVVAKPNSRHRWNKPPIDTTTLTTGTGGWVETAFAYNLSDWT